jgi:hypothetical protein
MDLHLSRATLPVCLAFTVVACGGDLDPGSGNDPGSGTRTLYVDGDIEATPLITNASRAADFQTRFDVAVRKNSIAVTTGTVTVSSNGGTVALTFDAGEDRWRGTQAGYHEVYELNVVSGDDSVDGVRVDGPALHYFTAPLPGAGVDATLPLTVRWQRDEAASVASFETDQIGELEIADTGSYSVPVGGLKSDRDQATDERLRLDRSARVTPAGAIADSSLRVEIRNQIDILVAPTAL